MKNNQNIDDKTQLTLQTASHLVIDTKQIHEH